ncbi:MAG: ribonuclease P protein component [Bacteroidales bacterium]
MTNQYTFGKNERLSGRNSVERLFGSGKSFNLNPFKIFYTVEETGMPPEVRILVAVSKKKFRHAVNRNRLKRIIREAYRLNKSHVLNNLDTHTSSLNIGFVYVDSEKDPSFALIQKSMITCLEKIARLVNENLSAGLSATGKPWLQAKRSRY